MNLSLGDYKHNVIFLMRVALPTETLRKKVFIYHLASGRSINSPFFIINQFNILQNIAKTHSSILRAIKSYINYKKI